MFGLRKKHSVPAKGGHSSGTLGRVRSLFISGRRGGDESGAAAVEFALVFPVFLMLALGIMEFGRAFWVRASLQFAVEEAARMAMAKYTVEAWTNGDFATYLADNFEADVEASAEDNVFGWNPSDATFTPSYDEASATLTVTGTVSFDFLIPMLALENVPLTATTTAPLIQ